MVIRTSLVVGVRSRSLLPSLSAVPHAMLLTAALVAPPPVTEGAVVPAPCQIAIDVASRVPLGWTRGDLEIFRAEAAAAWRPHGVALCWRDAEEACGGASSLLYVRLVDDVPRGRGSTARTLGWLGFSDRTGPGSLALLSVRLARELLASLEWGARRLGELPGAVERLLPRALGRALAHELGHFLLGRRSHSSTGLMRAVFYPADLADEHAGARLRLPRRDAEAVGRRCAGVSLPRATVASLATTPSGIP